MKDTKSKKIVTRYVLRGRDKHNKKIYETIHKSWKAAQEQYDLFELNGPACIYKIKITVHKHDV